MVKNFVYRVKNVDKILQGNTISMNFKQGKNFIETVSSGDLLWFADYNFIKDTEYHKLFAVATYVSMDKLELEDNIEQNDYENIGDITSTIFSCGLRKRNGTEVNKSQTPNKEYTYFELPLEKDVKNDNDNDEGNVELYYKNLYDLRDSNLICMNDGYSIHEYNHETKLMGDYVYLNTEYKYICKYSKVRQL